MIPAKGSAASDLITLAEEKDTTAEKLVQSYVYAKHPDMSVLIGTTRKEHLQASIDALDMSLSEKDLIRIETAFSDDMAWGIGMRNFTFRDGRMEG